VIIGDKLGWLWTAVFDSANANDEHGIVSETYEHSRSGTRELDS